MILNASAIVSLVALLFYCVLVFIILRRDIRSRIHQSFGIYLLSMIVWSFGSFMIFSELGSQGTLFWNRFMVVGQLAMPVAFFGFVQEFIGAGRKKWVFYGYSLYFAVQIVNLLGYIIKDAYLSSGRLIVEFYQPGVVISSVMWLLFLGLTGVTLLQEYRSAKDSFYLNRIRYLLLTIAVIFLGSLTNATGLEVFPVDIAFNIISALLISYAILRHQLLDITLVVRKGLLYSIPTAIIGAAYFLIISLAMSVFNALSGLQVFLLSLIVAIITALLANPMREKAQAWIDRLFFREKFDSTLMLQRISASAASFLDLEELTNMILDDVTTTLHIARAAIFLKREDVGDFTLVAQTGMDPSTKLKLESGHPIARVLATRDQALTWREIDVMPRFYSLWERETEDLLSMQVELFIPLKAKGELVGIFASGPKISGETFTQDDQLTLMTLSNNTAVAIENARLYSVAQQELLERKVAEGKLQRQLYRMRAIRTIDSAITSSVDLDAILNLILEQVSVQLQVDTAAVLVLNQETRTLSYAAGRGFRTAALQHTRLELGVGLAGRAARERSIVHVLDLSQEETSLQASPLLMSEGFVTYYGVPLVVKGQVKGVLEVFHRSMLVPDREWFGFLESLATETAIAVENAELFNDLQDSNIELAVAYSSTLEGWSRALELRDMETEGHSQRVTKLSLELARATGLTDEELVHIRHGALLHDIGKMGIPDKILLKPGPLDDEEWAIMRQHPEHGYQLLSGISFLRPALDIPIGHHEKWDGTGYPGGLKGTKIPLPARIFAVVDVWDALLSDRPYRKAWPVADALEYIRDEANRHFDPAISSLFLDQIERVLRKKNRDRLGRVIERER